jgi:hypothetical protein
MQRTKNKMKGSHSFFTFLRASFNFSFAKTVEAMNIE